MHRAILSLGSNIEPRAVHLRKAVDAIRAIPGTRVAAESSVAETDGVGVPDEFAAMKFLNMAAIVETPLDPFGLLEELQRIENSLGRVRTVKNGPRTIDIDIVDFDGMTMDTNELILPHPRAAERDFVKIPVRELLKENAPPFCL